MIVGTFGRPGSGKTTWLASIVVKNDQRIKFNSILDKLHFPKIFRFRVYDQIYSTEPIKGCYIITPQDLGLFKPFPNSAILLSEAGCDFSNRMFKSIPKYSTDFVAQHRHYSCDIYFESQAVDLDKKIRDRVAYLYIIRKSMIFPDVSWMQRVGYDVDVDEQTHDLVEAYSIAKGLLKVVSYLVGRSKLFYRRPYYKAFDTHYQGLKFQRPTGDYTRRYGDEEKPKGEAAK